MTVHETYTAILKRCDQVRDEKGDTSQPLADVCEMIQDLRVTSARERTRRALILQMVRYDEWLGFDWEALRRQAETALVWVAEPKDT